MQPDEPTGPSLKKELTEEQRRRNQGASGDGGDDVAATASSGCGAWDCDLPGCDFCDGCDLLVFLRVSSLLLVAAAVLPEHGGAAVVRLLLRGYRRWLTRFTPRCPSTPSCSAYGAAAVESLGVRRGLAATAQRVRTCGSA